jgi:hypothetical protein
VGCGNIMEELLIMIRDLSLECDNPIMLKSLTLIPVRNGMERYDSIIFWFYSFYEFR